MDYLNDAKISTEESPVTPPKVDSVYQDILMHQLDLFGLSDVVFPVQLLDSKIIQDASFVSQLHDWLDEDGSDGELVLLYCSTRDGRNDVTFHSKCDHKGPTLTVVETTDGHIIGGYSDVHWDCDYISFQPSHKAFLFAISKSNSFSPSKMKLKGSQNNHAIHHNKSYGPTFGSGNDLKVQGQYVYITKIGFTYYGAPSSMQTETKYKIKEMEVFQVISPLPNIPSPRPIFTPSINTILNKKWATLAKIELDLVVLEECFEDEKRIISFMSTTNDEDVLLLNVSGTCLATAHQTLKVYPESTLVSKVANQNNGNKKTNTRPITEWNSEEVVAWLNRIDKLSSSVVKNFEDEEVTGRELVALEREDFEYFGVTRRGVIAFILADIKKLVKAHNENAFLIEHSPYCIEKIIDHLRASSSCYS